MRPSSLVVPLTLLLAAAATPAMARERCDTPGKEQGLKLQWNFQVGDRYTQEEQEIFDTMALRQQGVNPRMVTRTADGCLEAWVPDGQGGMQTMYFDADTFQLKLD